MLIRVFSRGYKTFFLTQGKKRRKGKEIKSFSLKPEIRSRVADFSGPSLQHGVDAWPFNVAVGEQVWKRDEKEKENCRAGRFGSRVNGRVEGKREGGGGWGGRERGRGGSRQREGRKENK